MLKRLRLKFILVNMVIVTLVLLTVFTVLIFITQENLEQENVQMMKALATYSIRVTRPGERTSELARPFFILRISLSGSISTSGSAYYDLSDMQYLAELADGAINAEEPTGVLKGYGLRYHREQIPEGMRIVYADMSGEVNTIRQLTKTCALIGGGALFGFLLISVFLAGWVLKPVEEAWEQQRRFVSDASHELKTPLTVIMTNAQLLENAEYDNEERSRFINNIITMTGQMRGLTEGLLDLSRADKSGMGTDRKRLDLSEIISEALLVFEPLFFERDLLLSSAVGAGIMVKGNEAKLRQVVDILLDNAQKYSDNGVVRVALRGYGRYALLSVATPGEPLSQRERKNIFKRFYRTDKARTRDGSYGLGLAIAESIVSEHRGRIWAESGVGVNTFFVQIPLG